MYTRGLELIGSSFLVKENVVDRTLNWYLGELGCCRCEHDVELTKHQQDTRGQQLALLGRRYAAKHSNLHRVVLVHWNRTCALWDLRRREVAIIDDEGRDIFDALKQRIKKCSHLHIGVLDHGDFAEVVVKMSDGPAERMACDHGALSSLV